MCPSSRYMVIFLCIGIVGSVQSKAAEKILWNINFNDLQEGSALDAAPFDTSSANTRPQAIKQDSENLLVGVASLGSLADKPLRVVKATQANYSPKFELLMEDVLTSGKVTLEADVEVVAAQPAGGHPVEIVFSIGVLNASKEIPYRVCFGALRTGQLLVNAQGLAEGGKPAPKSDRTFPMGASLKVLLEIDLSKNTFSLSINGDFLADGLADESLYTNFRGFAFTDGTAVGGNYGGTSEIAIDNIKVTYKE